MKNIFKEMERIQIIQKKIGFDIFRFESNNKEELEILILGYFVNALKLANQFYPRYFHKRDNNDPPDFDIFDFNRKFIKKIEVTESLKPNRRRQQQYVKNLPRGKFEYDNRNLTSLCNTLKNKFLSKYTNTDLVIYLNINIHDISSLGLWHKIIENKIKGWMKNDELDFNDCSFDYVYIIDSNGLRLLKIFPKFSLIYTPDCIEKNF